MDILNEHCAHDMYTLSIQTIIFYYLKGFFGRNKRHQIIG